jgi:hypothetical protein
MKGLFLAAAAVLAMTSGALAQGMTPDAGSAPPSYTTPASPPLSGSTPPSQSMGVIAHVNPGDMDLQERNNGGQRSIEMIQTTLLNTLGGLGYQGVHDVRKVGDRYQTQALAPDGEWITVELDPQSGTISQAR